MTISADHELYEPSVPAAQVADIVARLEDLDTVTGGSAESLDSPRDYLNRASELLCAENRQASLEVLQTGWPSLERLRLRAPEDVPDELLLEYMSGLIDRADDSGDADLAEEWVDRRLAFLEETGRSEQAAIERTLGLAAYRDPRPEDFDLIERVVTAAIGSDSALSVRLVWGVALSNAGRHPEAIEVLEAVREAFESRGLIESECAARFLVEDSYVQLGDEESSLAHIAFITEHTTNRALLGMVRFKRARLTMGTSGLHSETLYDLLNAVELFTACGVRNGATMAALALGNQLQEIGESSAAVAAYSVALDHAERSESRFRAAAASALGSAHVQNDDFAPAVQVLSRFLESPEPEDGSQAVERAMALNSIAHAHLREQRVGEAAEAWEESVPRFLTAEDPESASGAAANVARLAFADNRHDDALRWIRTALSIVEKHELHPMRATEHMAFMATVMAKEKDPDALDVIDSAVEIAAQFEAVFHRPQYLETRSVVLFDLGRSDESVAASLLAADEYGQIEETDEGARCEIRAADLLRQLNRNVEAASVYRSAIDRAPGRSDYLYAAYQGLAASLSAVGQVQEAKAAHEEANAWAARAALEGRSLD